MTAAGWVLKFKKLLSRNDRMIELYAEGSNMIHPFPVRQFELKRAAKLLKTRLPDSGGNKDSFNPAEFVELFKSAEPPVKIIKLKKNRSHFSYMEGWIELAEVKFPQTEIQTISVHAYELGDVKKILESLSLGKQLKVMNYIDACRLMS
jgi:hypothetical protein